MAIDKMKLIQALDEVNDLARSILSTATPVRSC